VITVEHITKIYGKKANRFTALDNVSFTIPDRATVAIIGKSGSGKSTLMHIMSGLDHPTSGQVTVGDKNLQSLKPKAVDIFRAKEMGFIFQAFFVEPNQTCYQNVMLPLEIAKMRPRLRRQMVMDALGQVELDDKANARARDLSGGQKQRLAIARAIVNKPRLIFADEPTGNLDSQTGDKVMDMLFNLNRTLGSTLIIVTHDIELARQCQMQIVLRDGRVERVIGPKTAQTARRPQSQPLRPPAKKPPLRPGGAYVS
jgi:putative ABC transport system ATP-binding protein